ncbi:hypothetical protein NEF87_002087 [Candidatus Lokiarchaeum ossiferum]|uniref:Probable membrane transporter protein n=1 Tax=Candidatus Lokiarchaeum ossiferum TaxID=2951803 RepID=A0ABY6HTX6_9ARCH|nr:hypothetical protein NEF87_002087 [Candidatus Lokiarchaeum sp. B-35]
MEIISLALLLILSFAIYFFLSMVGLGGGMLVVPMLILVFEIPPSIAIGTSLFAMSISTFAATMGYWSRQSVNWKLALAYNVFDIPGIILGALLTKIAPTAVLEFICGCGIIVLAIVVLTKKSIQKRSASIANQEAEDDNFYEPDFSFAWTGKNLIVVIFSSFMGGLITGMVGIGGGTVDTTSMISIGIPMNYAAGSSSLAMFMTNIFGAVTHISLGNIWWDYAIPLGIVALIAAFLGSRLAPKLNSTMLRKMLGIIALITGLRLAFNIL